MIRHIALISAAVFVSFSSAAFAQDAQPHRGRAEPTPKSSAPVSSTAAAGF